VRVTLYSYTPVVDDTHGGLNGGPICWRWIKANDKLGSIVKDRGRRPEGGEREPIQILLQELAYVSSLNPKVKTL
jgi:hypothetical protein